MKKIKISIVLIICLIAFAITNNVLMMKKFIKEKELINLFGGVEQLYYTTDSITDFKNICFKGDFFQQQIFVNKSDSFSVRIPRAWHEKNMISLVKSNDTLVVSVQNISKKYAFKGINMYVTMPEINYASSEKSGSVHIHGFKEDSLTVTAHNWGMLWLDEDTITEFKLIGLNNSQTGTFEKTVIKNANLTIQDESKFMSRHTEYENVIKNIGEQVTLEATGEDRYKILE